MSVSDIVSFFVSSFISSFVSSTVDASVCVSLSDSALALSWSDASIGVSCVDALPEFSSIFKFPCSLLFSAFDTWSLTAQEKIADLIDYNGKIVVSVNGDEMQLPKPVKVNGMAVTEEYLIQNGDEIEVFTSYTYDSFLAFMDMCALSPYSPFVTRFLPFTV